MNCCKCNKEIDISKNEIPEPKWFGSYESDKIKKVICLTCIRLEKDQTIWDK